MTLQHRVRAAERTADRNRPPVPSRGVCDRIEELTAAYLTNPPTFAPAVEAGILTAVERQLRADERFFPAPLEDRP
jgi:hypothetical protein